MRRLFRLIVLGGAVYGAKALYDKWMRQPATQPSYGVGYDTPTGTDPAAKWSEPGYQDKSFGQAVKQDQELVEQLVDESHGDMGAAEERFRTESAGAPVLARQDNEPV